MKIPGVHLQIVSNQCTNFQINPCTHFPEHAWKKSCPQTGDTQTDRQTDGQGETKIPPKFVCGSLIKLQRKLKKN